MADAFPPKGSRRRPEIVGRLAAVSHRPLTWVILAVVVWVALRVAVDRDGAAAFEAGLAAVLGAAVGVALATRAGNRRADRAEEEAARLTAELESRVAARTAELAGVNRDLEGFSYSVSHDLRAPLRAIRGFADILVAEHSDDLDEEGRRLLHVIVSSSDRMATLIDDLLEFSRSNRRELEARRIDMAALARSVVEESLRAHDGRRVDVQMDALPPATGDAHLVRQVLENLIGNALKFTGPTPEPRVWMGARREGERNVYVVRDNGVGYDARYADKLFQVFQRLHPQRDFEGSGIGLALAKRIIERHGGRVGARGAPGEGATFWFSLPSA